MLVRASSFGLEQPGHEADDQPKASAEVRNVCSCTYTTACLHAVQKKNFTFTLPCVLHG
jgi:hypothetical protein